MSKEEALEKINMGSGRMPGFAKLVKGREEEILSFLFEESNDQLVEQVIELTDTANKYLNLTAYSFFRDSERRPALKPPWGTLNAINLNTGEYEWKIPLGNQPEYQQSGAPETGTANYGGPIVTDGGIVLIGATADKKLRAFAKDTGETLWEYTMPGNGYASPSTYMINNKQFMVIAVSAGRNNAGSSIMAFTLPQ
jgi:quinoprotein glucose dehydrogenase